MRDGFAKWYKCHREGIVGIAREVGRYSGRFRSKAASLQSRLGRWFVRSLCDRDCEDKDLEPVASTGCQFARLQSRIHPSPTPSRLVLGSRLARLKEVEFRKDANFQ